MLPIYLITCFHPSYGNDLMGYAGIVLAEGKSVEDRFKEHLSACGDSPYLHNAIRKYGKQWFRVEQIDAANTPEQAKELERWWIKRLGTKCPTGYNLTDGGDGTLGLPKEVIQTRAASIKRSWQDPARRAAGIAAFKANWANPDCRSAMITALSLSHHGLKQAPETVAKRVAKTTGLKRAGAALANLRAASARRKGVPLSDEAKSNMSRAHKGQVPWNKGLKKEVHRYE